MDEKAGTQRKNEKERALTVVIFLLVILLFDIGMCLDRQHDKKMKEIYNDATNGNQAGIAVQHTEE